MSEQSEDISEPAAGAFWSYARSDDQNEAGLICRLSERIGAEYRAITGSALEVFVDQQALRWGDDWEREIEKAVLATNFLVPIVTPSYFSSQACRTELLSFSAQSFKAGAPSLVMPIYWIDVPELTAEGSEAADEAKALIARHQWLDLREVRLEDEQSSVFRKAVHGAAKNLAARVEQLVALAGPTVTAKPTSRTERRSSTPEPDPDPSDGDPAEPGMLERVAALEDAMPDLVSIMSELSEEVGEIGDVMANASGFDENSTMKQRVVIATQTAAAMQPHTARFEALGQRYAATVVEMDPGVLDLIQADEATEVDPDDGTTFLDTVIQLADNSGEAMDEASAMRAVIADLPKVSRSFSAPAKSVTRGLQGLLDGQRRIDAWGEHARLRQIEAAGNSESGPGHD